MYGIGWAGRRAPQCLLDLVGYSCCRRAWSSEPTQSGNAVESADAAERHLVIEI